MVSRRVTSNMQRNPVKTFFAGLVCPIGILLFLFSAFFKLLNFLRLITREISQTLHLAFVIIYPVSSVGVGRGANFQDISSTGPF